ncbi:hypothetical protein ACQEU6_17030 [Spirillospora sp. CA-108201]
MLAGWAITGALCVLAWQVGELQLWVLPLLSWIAYEICYVPTTCGVKTGRNEPCRNAADGRLYACKEQPSHPPLKRDALYRLLGLRHGPAPAAGSTRRTTGTYNAEPAPESVTIDPHQKIMLYLTIIATIAGAVQTIWAVKDSVF